MTRVALVKMLVAFVSSFLTDRFVINVVVVLLQWLVNRTQNDLDNKVFAEVKKALDKNYGSEVNLYKQLR